MNWESQYAQISNRMDQLKLQKTIGVETIDNGSTVCIWTHATSACP